MPEIQRVMRISQKYRTPTEMRYSVLNDLKFPDSPSKYFQAVREQNVFVTNLFFLACDYDVLLNEVEIMKIDLTEIKGKKAKFLKQIKKAEISKSEFKLYLMELDGKARCRELRNWEKLKTELTQKENFDIENVDTNQLESYEKRWKKEIQLGNINNKSMLHAIAQLETVKNEN